MGKVAVAKQEKAEKRTQQRGQSVQENLSKVSSNRQTVAEIRQQEEKPGIFRRIWNWIKGLFSRKSNTVMENGTDANVVQQNMAVQTDTAEIPENIKDTLPPTVTEEGISAPPQDTPTPTHDEVAEITQKPSDKPQDTLQDDPQVAVQDTPQNAPEKPKVYKADGITFALTYQEDGTIFSTAGNVQVMGKEVAWKAEKEIVVTEEGDTFSATGKLGIETDQFTAKGLTVTAQGEAVTYQTSEEAFQLQSGDLMLSFSTEKTLGSLAELQPVSIVVDRTIPGVGKPELKPENVVFGKEISMDSAKAEVDGKQIPVVSKLFGTDQKATVQLRKGENGLEYGVFLPGAVFQTDPSKLLHLISLQSTDLFACATGEEKLSFSLPDGTSTLYLKNKKLVDFSVPSGIQITSGSTIEKIDVALEQWNAGSYTVQGSNLSLDLEKENFEIHVASLTDDQEKLTVSNVGFHLGKDGLLADNATAEYKMGKDLPTVQASMKNLKVDENQKLTFDQLTASVSGLKWNDVVDVPNLELTLSATEEAFRAQLSGKGSLALEKRFFSLSSKDMALDFSYEKGRETTEEKAKFGDFSGKISGTLQAKVTLNQKDLATAEVTDFSVGNDKLSLGRVSLVLNTEGIVEDLRIIGEVAAKNLSVSKEGLTLDGFSMNLTEAKYKNAEIGLVGESQLEEGKEQEMDISALNGEVKLGSATLSADTPKLLMKLDKEQLKFGGKAEKLSASYGDYALSTENFQFYYGEAVKLGTVSVENLPLGEQAKKLLSVEDLTLSATDVEMDKNGIKLGGVKAEVGTDIALFGKLSLSKVGVSLEASDFDTLADAAIGVEGELTYSDSVVTKLSGTASYKMEKEKKYAPEFQGVQDVTLELGKIGTGSFSEIEEKSGGFAIKNLTLAHKESEEEEDTDSEGGEESFADKLLGALPSVTVTIDQLVYQKGAFRKPKKDEWHVSKFEKTLKFAEDAIELAVKYDNGKVSGKVAGTYHLPSDRKTEKDATTDIVEIRFPIPLPFFPALKATIGGRAFAGFTAGMDATLESAQAQKKGSSRFGFEANANITANAGLAVVLGLELGVGKLNASGEVEGKGEMCAEGKLNGKTALEYFPGKPLRECFAIDKNVTALSFDATGALTLSINLVAGVQLPAVFLLDSKKLEHNFTLFEVELGNAKVKGSVKREEDKFVFAGDGKFESTIGKVNLEKETEELKSLDESYEKLEAILDEIDLAIKKVKEKGGKEILGGADIFRSVQGRQIMNLQVHLVEVIQNSSKTVGKIYEKLESLKKYLESHGTDAIVKAQNQGYSNLQIRDAKTALEILGTDQEKKDISGDYHAVIQNMQKILSNDAKIEQLAMLDPIAFHNTLKAYKLETGFFESSENWTKKKMKDSEETLTEHAKTLSKKMYQNTEAVEALDGAKKNVQLGQGVTEKTNTKILKNAVEALESKNIYSGYTDLLKQKQKAVEAGRKLESAEAELEKENQDTEPDNEKKKNLKNLQKKRDDAEKEYQECSKAYADLLSKHDSEKQGNFAQYFYLFKENMEKETGQAELVERKMEVKPLENDGKQQGLEERKEYVIVMLHQVIDFYTQKAKKEGTSEIELDKDATKRMNERVQNIRSKEERPEEDSLKELQDVNGIYLSYSKKIGDYSVLCGESIKKMEWISSIDYQNMTTLDEYEKRSQEIRNMLDWMNQSNLEQGVTEKDVELLEQQTKK